MVAQTSEIFQRIVCEKKGCVLWITLNRPEAKNAQDPQTREELVSALSSGRDDDGIHIIVLTGAGEIFCAGGDIAGFPQTPIEFMEKIGLQLKGRKRPIELIREIPKPVIAMVNGPALGAGFELVLACDIVIAAESARFSQPEIRVGLIPGGGGTQLLPRLVGEKKAKELIFTGESISAEEAFRLGLVNKVVPLEKLKETVETFVSILLQKSPVVLKLAKLAVNKSLEMPLSAGLSYESDLCALCFGTEDLKEGVRAFLEKRTPRFKGL